MIFTKSEIITVDEMTAKIKDALSSSKDLQNISIRGELLGFKLHTSGHAYFTILGRETRVSCVLFRSNAASVVAWPKDGDEVLVRGRIDVYGARGAYQIYASTLLPLGEGAKTRAKEMLKNKLAKEGVFDPANKRPFPLFPQKVAIITSPTGAAVWDVIKISRTRFPAAELIIVPSLMQGLSANEEIAKAFQSLRYISGLSFAMLVRGGGSRDDLDTFDDETVVRAVSSSCVPVITGLGHQVDSTLADMAADAFAPTPSGAAERVFPDAKDLLRRISSSYRGMQTGVVSKVNRLSDSVETRTSRLMFNFMKCSFEPSSLALSNIQNKMTEKINKKIDSAAARLDLAARTLLGASPLNILSKGYSICSDISGFTLKSITEVTRGDKINVRMKDGLFSAIVDEVKKNDILGR